MHSIVPERDQREIHEPLQYICLKIQNDIVVTYEIQEASSLSH
jgi:hypothetical protein